MEENVLEEFKLSTQVLLARSSVATACLAQEGLALVGLEPRHEGLERGANVVCYTLGMSSRVV